MVTEARRKIYSAPDAGTATAGRSYVFGAISLPITAEVCSLLCLCLNGLSRVSTPSRATSRVVAWELFIARSTRRSTATSRSQYSTHNTAVTHRFSRAFSEKPAPWPASPPPYHRGLRCDRRSRSALDRHGILPWQEPQTAAHGAGSVFRSGDESTNWPPKIPPETDGAWLDFDRTSPR